MKSLCVALCIVWSTFALSEEPTFRWPLPAAADAAKLTAAAFPGSDAVILVKEQGFTEGTHTRSLFVIYNDVTVQSEAIMVKLFNDKAVEQFGSFSYEYPHMLEKEERHVFRIRVRVMKPDGTVQVLPDTSIKQVTGVATAGGRALTDKVMYKIPSLAPGDIVQYEYSHAEPYSYKRQVLFFYHDRYPVVTSVAYVIMEKKTEVSYKHFPPDKFGPPEVKDLGSAVCNVWTLNNLPAIPDEPFGRPLSEVSYLTTVVSNNEENDGNGWRPVAKNYYQENIEEGSLPSSFMEDLGLNPSLKNADWPQIDTLYTALRKYFRLKTTVSKYTAYKQVDKQIKNKEADASDLAFMMLKALERWKVQATPVLVRDRREGEYEMSVPSMVWFSRLALLISLNGRDVLYDFDRCIPTTYEAPWFINPSTMFAVQDTGGYHFQLKSPSTWRGHISAESHLITLKPGKRASDSVAFTLKGAFAQNKRGALYSKTGEDLDKAVRSFLEDNAVQETEHAEINNFLDEPLIRINGTGNSRGASTAIDSFLTYQPRNHLLRSFRENFTLPARHFDIDLYEPFAYNLRWLIEIPAQHRVDRLPDDAQIVGPSGATAQVSCMQHDNQVEVNAMVVFASANIPLAKYGEWRAFLDKVNNSLERQIVFRKK
jgi:hypothetical protein